jgi:pimeloyl-ACP methyl ester carboxylesterase
VMSEAVLDYEWQTAHQPGARFAPASFAAGFLDPEGEIEDALAAVDVPVTLVWGRNSDLSPLAEGRAIAEVGDTELVVFDRAKLLPHVEHPEEFLEVVRDEVAPEP